MPLPTSALNLNEALEQCWSAASSPYCLSTQLRSPQPSASLQSNSWGKDFGRRRSSNTTTTSTSSAGGLTQEKSQRRRKSLFSKKPRSEHLFDAMLEEDAQKLQRQFVDPFARNTQYNLVGTVVSLQQSSDRGAGKSDSGSLLSRTRSTQRLSAHQQKQQQRQWQQQQLKKEALDRVSDLVCLSVENQTEMSRGHIGASSPTFLSPSPTTCDRYFYPVAEPASPSSPGNSTGSSTSLVAFPMHGRAGRGLYLTVNSDADTTGDLSSVASPSLSTISTKADCPRDSELDAPPEGDEGPQSAFWLHVPSPAQHTILLPSAMKRHPSRTMELDTSKRSSASLRAEIGHGSMSKPASTLTSRLYANSQQQSFDWSDSEDSRTSLHPPPPLRPSRNPLRSRSKSLSAATARARGTDRASIRSSSPPPPLPTPPTPLSSSSSVVVASGLVGPLNLTPVQSQSGSRRTSEHGRPRVGRSDSWASIASNGSFEEQQGPPFHTPTFGTSQWSSLPVS
nr:hypothetical protein BN887_04916 [Melanopsichium pennsylvanicum 4]